MLNKNDLINYLYEFHYRRDYFECHEIMEESWKKQLSFTKDDAEVGLIQFAVSLYHYRRGNFKGAATCIKKALLNTYVHKEVLEYTGIDSNHLINTMETLLTNINHHTPYTSPEIKINEALYASIISYHPDYRINDESVNEKIIHRHKLRDRTDVISARLLSMRDKNPVHDSPDKRH